MKVRAKFQVQHVAGENVVLTAAIDAANAGWSKYTPNGRIDMTISNPEALEQFKPGAFVYVDFASAPAVDPV